MTETTERVTIGKLGRPHGIKGEIRLFLSNPASRTLAEGLDVYIVADDIEPVAATVEKARYTDKFVIVKFDHIDDRGDIDEFKHAHVEVDYEALPDLDDDEFYYVDLVGAPVYVAKTENGEVADGADPIGEVDRFFATGANDVMVIDAGDDELFAPLVEHAVLLLDFDEHRVVVQPLDVWAPADYGDEQ